MQILVLFVCRARDLFAWFVMTPLLSCYRVEYVLVYRIRSSTIIYHLSSTITRGLHVPTMNWTGGQLHRSARQGTLSKTQRQNFAKSRQVALDRASRHLTTFHGFIPGFTAFSSTGDIQNGVCRESQGVATDESS